MFAEKEIIMKLCKDRTIKERYITAKRLLILMFVVMIAILGFFVYDCIIDGAIDGSKITSFCSVTCLFCATAVNAKRLRDQMEEEKENIQ